MMKQKICLQFVQKYKKNSNLMNIRVIMNIEIYTVKIQKIMINIHMEGI